MLVTGDWLPSEDIDWSRRIAVRAIAMPIAAVTRIPIELSSSPGDIPAVASALLTISEGGVIRRPANDSAYPRHAAQTTGRQRRETSWPSGTVRKITPRTLSANGPPRARARHAES